MRLNDSSFAMLTGHQFAQQLQTAAVALNGIVRCAIGVPESRMAQRGSIARLGSIPSPNFLNHAP